MRRLTNVHGWKQQSVFARIPASGPRRGRVPVKLHVFLALCLRLAVVLANHNRGNDVASLDIMLREPFCTTAEAVINIPADTSTEFRQPFVLNLRELRFDSLTMRHHSAGRARALC